MQILRNWADIEKLGGRDWLTPAEIRLMDAVQRGDICALGDDIPEPGTPNPDQRVRAEVLRYLVLGGCPACQTTDQGVHITGAYITGDVDFDFGTAHGPLALDHCYVGRPMRAVQARFERFDLSDCHITGLNADGAHIAGDVFLLGLRSSAGISFAGAKIGGQLAADYCTLNATKGDAFSIHSARVDGGLYLTKARITGKTRLHEATIGVSFRARGATFTATKLDALVCRNMHVKGDVRLSPYSDPKSQNDSSTPVTVVGEMRLEGARIEGSLNLEGIQLSNDKGHALNGQRMQVRHQLIWKKVTVSEGAVSLNGASVGELDDDPANWPDCGQLILDGFRYGRIRGKVSIAKERLQWLKDGSHFDGQFFPQPYTQYAKFLRDTGHDGEASAVLALREGMIFAEARARRRASGTPFATITNFLQWIWSGLLFLLAGYGHHPFRSVYALLLLVALTTVPAQLAWDEGSMAPNAAPILATDHWQALARTAQNPAVDWSNSVPGKDWETFFAPAYAADLVIPIINFGQNEAWAPSTERGPWGYHLWWLRWVVTVSGWIVTALGAAAITGLIRRE